MKALEEKFIAVDILYLTEINEERMLHNNYYRVVPEGGSVVAER